MQCDLRNKYKLISKVNLTAHLASGNNLWFFECTLFPLNAKSYLVVRYKFLIPCSTSGAARLLMQYI